MSICRKPFCAKAVFDINESKRISQICKVNTEIVQIMYDIPYMSKGSV